MEIPLFAPTFSGTLLEGDLRPNLVTVYSSIVLHTLKKFGNNSYFAGD
jgi:hypothetical protein